MTTALSPIIVSRLKKAATGNGFDQELEREGDWLVFASTQCPLRLWLGAFGGAVFLVAFS
jgi:putative restriction endonuclease